MYINKFKLNLQYLASISTMKHRTNLKFGDNIYYCWSSGPSAPIAGNSTSVGAMMPDGAAPSALPPLPGLFDSAPRTSGTTTDGIDSGPGPGSASLNLPSQPTVQDNGVKAVQALYAMDPSNQDVRNMLESLSVQRRL